jgi:nicotinate phosphoribosyltransferase
MSVFNHLRLDSGVFKLDVERLQKGWYSDKYFVNITNMLVALRQERYSFSPHTPRLSTDQSNLEYNPGDLEVEMQWFTRHPGNTVIVGVDKALAILRECTGYWEAGKFVNTWDRLEVWAVEDGSTAVYQGNPENVQPVLRVRGRYADFANLETPTLGILTRASRVATNVYDTLVAARGKPVLFFPARFDLHEVQAADGYAYQIAVQRFNEDYGKGLGSFVSTDAQGDWWGGAGGGTVAHALIACFMGDTAEAMLAFSSTVDPTVLRIALVDFNNDSVRDSLATCESMFRRYMAEKDAGNPERAKRFVLNGVRLDTSASMRDASLEALGDPLLDQGVNPRLVHNVRAALDDAWKNWNLPPEWITEARNYCRNVKIVVSGGFNIAKITRFENQSVPVDIYAVGSAFFDNYEATKMDFTADVVRVKVDGQWLDLAKTGRRACDNPNLLRIK